MRELSHSSVELLDQEIVDIVPGEDVELLDSICAIIGQ